MKTPRPTVGARPTVGIVACVKSIYGQPYHAVGDKYLRALAEGAEVQPLIVPAFGEDYDHALLARQFDGLLFTGSPSNVEPRHYGGDGGDAKWFDPARDATTLPLHREAASAGTPVLAICRGFQEMNVAFGGTLNQDVAAIPGRMSHHAPPDSDIDTVYGQAHKISIAPGGRLLPIAGVAEMTVNSAHFQGIDRLAEPLLAEAVAPDGQIEAISLKSAGAFSLGVQWHPEWRFWEREADKAIFHAFGLACRARMAERARLPMRAGVGPAA